MSAVRRTVVVAEMQMRDLLRRRAVMVLLVLLPAAFYFSVPASEPWSLLSGAIGVSWAVAAAGMFAVLGWRRADPRLLLLGAPAWHGLLGRLLVVHGLGVGLVALFAPMIVIRSSQHIDEPGLMVLGLVLLAVVSAAMGLAIGALVPRELEGTLVLIGVIGVAMSVPPESAIAFTLPLWGPIETINVATNTTESTLSTVLAHTAASFAVLLAGALAAWRRRVRVHRSQPALVAQSSS